MLTATKVKALKPREKPYKVSDGHGLYIEVLPTPRPKGAKYWRQKYRFHGKEKRLAHGVYPQVTLAEARDKRDEALALLRKNIDPGKEKKQRKRTTTNTFESVAREWLEVQRGNWSERHKLRVTTILENNLFPYIGSEPITTITPTDLLDVLRKVEGRGALDLAGRLRQKSEAIFQYAILTERAESNPATQLKRTLKTKPVKHRAALDRKDLPELLEKLDDYQGDPVTLAATRMLLLTFVRTGEMRFATWDEIDWDEQMWRIPAARMKMKRDHLVPLSNQAVTILKNLDPITGSYQYVFASPIKPLQPISENTVLYALYRMGYHSRATGHGFRATASTILNEMGYNADAIERQLAHVERNKVRAAYNRSEYLADRVEMMQAWADYLDSIADNVVPIRAGQ